MKHDIIQKSFKKYISSNVDEAGDDYLFMNWSNSDEDIKQN